MAEGEVLNPASIVAKDVTTGRPTPTEQTGGELHVRNKGTGVMAAASVDENNGITADVDAAVAAATGLRLMGYACRESAGVAAAFTIVHGATGAGGSSVVPVELAANGSDHEWFGPDGIDVASGISIDWIAGTVDVELFHKTVT